MRRISANLKLSSRAYLILSIVWFIIAAYVIITEGNIKSAGLWLFLGAAFVFLFIDSRKNPEAYKSKDEK